jgi:hypothetical protein
MITKQYAGLYLATNHYARELDPGLAPKDIRDKLKSARDAVEAEERARVESEIAETDKHVAESQYDALAVESARANKQLPDKTEEDKTKIAKYLATVALQDYNAAVSDAYRTQLILGAAFDDQSNRDQWLEGLYKQADADKAALAKLAPEVIRLTQNLALLEAASIFIGTYPHTDRIELSNVSYAAQAIDAAQNARLWTKPTPAAEAKFQTN